MKLTFAAISLTTFLAGMSLGQSAPSQPQFEAADVHPSAPGASEDGGFLHAGRSEFRGVTMLRLITTAYDVADERVVGGPTWLDTDRFDVTAKAPAGSSQDTLRSMLQALLADRFKLAVHNGEKALPVYVLTVNKRGSQLKESSGEGGPECKRNQENGVFTYTCQRLTMASLAERLPGVAPAYFDHPVVDRTGLKGEYDIAFKWSPKAQLGSRRGDAEAPSAISLFDSLDKLGIKAEPQTQPAPVVFVDYVDQKPAPNPPGTAEKLPPPATEFEVADIRPSKPGAPQNANMRNGRLEAIAFSMRELIGLAYGVDDPMVIGEKWLETEHFDIVAKADPTTSFEALRTMLQKLLEQRFKLVVHKEDQPVPVYALTLPGKKNPKLKEPDATSRAACKLSVDKGLRTYTCQNTTMAQFAEKLRQVAGGYLDHPVVDLTGLKGSYDFAVSWSPVGRVLGPVGRAGEGGGASAGVPSAVEPNTGLTIFEAVDKQLGLKLASQKHPMPVVVVDRINRTPTEN